MFSFEQRWTHIVMTGFAGSSDGFRPDDDVDYVDGAKRFMSAASDKACLGLRFAVVLALTSPIWMCGRMSTLTGLSPVDRSLVLDRMGRHSVFFVRELCLLLKLVACMAIFRSAAARERSGFDRQEERVSLRVLKTEAA
jgi:hypothetical protein